MFEAIEKKYNSRPDPVDYFGTVYGQGYMHRLITYVPGLSKEEIKDIQDRTFYEIFEAYYNCGVRKEDILAAMEEYNYVAPPWAKFETKLMDEFFNAETKYDAINNFVTLYGIIEDIDSFTIRSVLDFGYRGDLDNAEKVKEFKDKIIAELGNQYPQTGDSSVLYIVIAAASLTAMSAIVFRRKRKVTE